MITFDTFYTIQRVSGLSQDDKPVGMKPGSIFMELDTGKRFIFDGETWHEQPAGGGIPSELESVTEYTLDEDWTTDALGNAEHFAQTYCNMLDTTDRRLYVCYITNNTSTISYRANFMSFQRYAASVNDYECVNVRNNWSNVQSTATSGRSFHLSAGSIVKVFVFKFGGIA